MKNSKKLNVLEDMLIKVYSQSVSHLNKSTVSQYISSVKSFKKIMINSFDFFLKIIVIINIFSFLINDWFN